MVMRVVKADGSAITSDDLTAVGIARRTGRAGVYNSSVAVVQPGCNRIVIAQSQSGRWTRGPDGPRRMWHKLLWKDGRLYMYGGFPGRAELELPYFEPVAYVPAVPAPFVPDGTMSVYWASYTNGVYTWYLMNASLATHTFDLQHLSTIYYTAGLAYPPNERYVIVMSATRFETVTVTAAALAASTSQRDVLYREFNWDTYLYPTRSFGTYPADNLYTHYVDRYSDNGRQYLTYGTSSGAGLNYPKYLYVQNGYFDFTRYSPPVRAQIGGYAYSAEVTADSERYFDRTRQIYYASLPDETQYKPQFMNSWDSATAFRSSLDNGWRFPNLRAKNDMWSWAHGETSWTSHGNISMRQWLAMGGSKPETFGGGDVSPEPGLVTCPTSAVQLYACAFSPSRIYCYGGTTALNADYDPDYTQAISEFWYADGQDL